MLTEEIGDGGDGATASLHEWITVAGIADRRAEHLAQAQAAEVTQDHHVGFKRARHAGGQ